MTTTWTAPPVSRAEPPEVAAEREALQGWLDYHRQTLLHKCAGLTGEQLTARAIAPSSLSLLGLVRHMAEVERAWFRRRLGRQPDLPMLYCDDAFPDGDFDLTEAVAAEADFAAFLAECELADAVARDRSLDDTFPGGRTGTPMDLRWVYLHMIEEYARHNGHADILREQIDGVTGD
ncbi:MAG: DinB family protein [Streptosporangiaceae bacterium]